MDISSSESSLRLNGGNTYRAIHTLYEELGSVGQNNPERFYTSLFHLLRLHKEFYRTAVMILLSEGTEESEIEDYRESIRQERVKFIGFLRGMKRPETMKQRIFRNRRIHEIVGFLEELVGDIFYDWKIEEGTNELIYYPAE